MAPSNNNEAGAAEATSTEAEKFVSQGDSLFREGQYLKAAAMYTKAVKKDPSNAEVHCNLSYAFLKECKFHKALSAAEAAVALDDGNHKAWFRKALALVALERWEEGIVGLMEVKKRQATHTNKEVDDMLELAKWRCKSKCLEEDKPVPEICKDAKRPEEEKKEEATSEEAPKEESREEKAKKLAAIQNAMQSRRVKKHNKNVMSQMAAGAVADKELVTKEMIAKTKAALEADQAVQARVKELSTDKTYEEKKKGMKEGQRLDYDSARVNRFSHTELEALLAAGDRASFKEPVAIVLPGVNKEEWGDEGQGISLWNAFSSADQQLNAAKFVRKFVEDTGAHAVMMVSPKAKVKYPALFEKNASSFEIGGEGFLVQLDTQRDEDRQAWFVEIESEGAAGVLHGLSEVDTWALLPSVFAESVKPVKKVGKGSKKGKRNAMAAVN